MLDILNRRLLAARMDARFVAMQFAVYDAALRELSISNAGGRLLLLVRNRQVTEINVAGVPLGLLPDVEYDEITIAVLPGDVILLASDGIHESTNQDQEEYGSDRLKALLASVEPVVSGLHHCSAHRQTLPMSTPVLACPRTMTVPC